MRVAQKHHHVNAEKTSSKNNEADLNNNEGEQEAGEGNPEVKKEYGNCIL